MLCVRSCSKLEQVIGKEGINHVSVGETEARTILFPQLRELHLEDLPELLAFCHSMGDLELPLLEEVFIENCPVMETFVRPLFDVSLPRISKSKYIGQSFFTKETFSLGSLHLPSLKRVRGIQDCDFAAKIFFHKEKKYAGEILKKFRMDDAKPIMTPVEEKLKLTKEGTGAVVDATTYRRLVGSLRYLTATRPDITYGVGLISRFMEFPRQSHLQAAKRILRYIKGTQSDGILYSRTNSISLVGYTDSDWAGDIMKYKSTSGYAFTLGSGIFSWSSKKQQVVALSTAEAEYMAATNCATQAIWFRRILEFLQHQQTSHTTILCDNKSAIDLTKNPVLHGRSKHINIKYHFIRELVRDKEIVVHYCPTADQVADIFTKPLKAGLFLKLKKMLGIIRFDELGLREANVES